MTRSTIFDNQPATPAQIILMILAVLGAFAIFAWLDYYDASVAECAEFGLEYRFSTGECHAQSEANR